MRVASAIVTVLLVACGGATTPEPTSGAGRSNQNAPPPRARLTPEDQVARLIDLVTEGNDRPGQRERLRSELTALRLDVPEAVQGRTACLDAWEAERRQRDDATVARGACRAVLVVLAGRYGLRDRLPMGPQPRPAPRVGARPPSRPGGSNAGGPQALVLRADGTYDQHLEGDLTDDDDRVPQDASPYDEYVLDVPQGWTIEVDMRSADFDTYLWLIGPEGTSILQDDDGGDGTNSRFSHRTNASGQHTVRANSYDGAGRGHYRLHVYAHP